MHSHKKKRKTRTRAPSAKNNLVHKQSAHSPLAAADDTALLPCTSLALLVLMVVPRNRGFHKPLCPTPEVDGRRSNISTPAVPVPIPAAGPGALVAPAGARAARAPSPPAIAFILFIFCHEENSRRENRVIIVQVRVNAPRSGLSHRGVQKIKRKTI